MLARTLLCVYANWLLPFYLFLPDSSSQFSNHGNHLPKGGTPSSKSRSSSKSAPAVSGRGHQLGPASSSSSSSADKPVLAKSQSSLGLLFCSASFVASVHNVLLLLTPVFETKEESLGVLVVSSVCIYGVPFTEICTEKKWDAKKETYTRLITCFPFCKKVYCTHNLCWVFSSFSHLPKSL